MQVPCAVDVSVVGVLIGWLIHWDDSCVEWKVPNECA